MTDVRTRTYRDMHARAAAASPTRAVILLYERLLADLRRAERYIQEKNPVEKGKNLLHANDILNELLASLNMEKGGELAKDLARLYTYLIKEINEIDATRDLERLRNVIEIVETIYEGWRQAYESLKEQEA